MYPSLKRVKEIADSGSYDRIPVAAEIYADRYTPVEIMRILRAASVHCYMLESAENNEARGRYTFLGYAPDMEITCLDGLLTILTGPEKENPKKETRQVEHPKDAIREILNQHKSPKMEGMPPFTGGLVGYFSYDYIRYAEPTLKNERMMQSDFRDVDLMLFDKVIVYDHYKQKIILIAGVYTANLEASYARAADSIGEMKQLLKEGKRAEFEPFRMQGELTPEFPKERYMEMVEKGKYYIREGDIFQVVLSDPQTVPASGSLFDVYRALRVTNPSPYMFYFSSDDIELAGASPETLVSLKDGVLHTFPLAGTRPRGKTREEDLELERGLLADEKELSEHNMLVDLGRNDLGKVSELGSVEVEKYLEIERYSQVMHIGSTVRGTLSSDCDAMDAVDSILPAGTLSGAPKIRACEIIDELEDRKRGVYGGAVGYLDFSGNMDTCIAIRLAYKKNGIVCVHSGAGIVADSVPETEFMECRNKARAVALAMKMAQEGLE